MKTLIQILGLFVLFSITVFPQFRIDGTILSDKLPAERLLQIQKSNVDDLQELGDRESLLSKSKSNIWQGIIKNRQIEFYEQEEVEVNGSRTTITKTQIENGFLLIERITQSWENGTWVNVRKWSRTYDENNNLIEDVLQDF